MYRPDDPPAVQQLVNDRDGFTELQRDLVLLLCLVGFDGDMQLSCRGTAALLKTLNMDYSAKKTK